MSDKMSLSIILPCYNESENIPLIFERFKKVLKGREGVEVLMVDNGSTDNTAEYIKKGLEQADYAFAKMVQVPVNRGYGFGIMEGVRQARGEVISWTHADMQTDPNDVLLAYDLFQKQKDLGQVFIKGKRVSRNFLDAFFTFGMSLLSSFALRSVLSDINAQPKMFHRTFLDKMVDPPDDFSLDLYVYYLARKEKMDILEQEVSFADRKYGEAKGGGSFKGKIKLILRTWKYIFELRTKLLRG